MSDLNKEFTVNVAGVPSGRRDVDVKILDENDTTFLSDGFENELPEVEGHSVSCETGIDSDTGLGARRITVMSWKGDPEVKGKRITNKSLTGQFNSWEAEHGIAVTSNAQDLGLVQAVTEQLIQRLK